MHMKPRGNKNQKWFTCHQCQARWERSSVNPGADTAPSDLMNFGVYATLTYEEVAQNRPSYCDWVQNTTEMESDVSPQLARFGHYLMMRADPGLDLEGAIPINTFSDSEAAAASSISSSWARP